MPARKTHLKSLLLGIRGCALCATKSKRRLRVWQWYESSVSWHPSRRDTISTTFYTLTYTQGHTHTHTSICAHRGRYTPKHIPKNINTDRRIHTGIHIRIYIYTHGTQKHTYQIFTHKQAYIHRYTHTHTQRRIHTRRHSSRSPASGIHLPCM